MINFLTFGNTDYMSLDRIKNLAKDFGKFDNIFTLTEKHIPEYINKHLKYITNNKAGYGNWIWKPYIIYKILNKIKENDILVYCDAGMYINKDGINRFEEYIEILKQDNIDMINFSTNNTYKVNYFVKIDAIMHYFPEIITKDYNCVYAGLMIIKKTNRTMDLIKDWLDLCENYNFLNNLTSVKYTEQKCYVGNDYDNGLFNLCVYKHNISHIIYPDEVNIYIDNKQLAHLNIEPKLWLEIFKKYLPNKPFYCIRHTPKFFK